MSSTINDIANLNFQYLFEEIPDLYLLLSPELTIITASNAYLKASFTTKENIVGKHLFEVFPDNPDDPSATGTFNLKKSLDFVIANKQPHAMALQKYDIRMSNGTFKEKYWDPLNKPILNEQNEVIYIIHSVKDVTELMLLKQQQAKQAEELQATNIKLLEEINQRKKLQFQLEETNAKLQLDVLTKTSELSSIFERITDGFIALDKNFCYTYANKKIGELTHRDPATLIGKNIWDEFPNAVNTATYHAFNKAMNEHCNVTNTDYFEPLNLWQENDIYSTENGLSIFIRDITEKKKAAIQLQENELKYRTIIEQANDGIQIVNPEGWFIDVNTTMLSITGYSKDELLRMNTKDILFEEDLHKTPLQAERLQNESKLITERRIKRKDGSELLVEINSCVLPDGKFLGMVRDITERRKVEEKLNEVHKEMYTALNRITDGVISVDNEFRYTFINDTALSTLNLKAEEILGKTLVEVRPELANTEFWEKYQEIMRTKIVGEIEGFFSPLNIWASVKIYPSKDGLTFFYKDVTDEKKIKDELISSEKKYRLLFDNNPLPMWMIDTHTLNIIDVNEAAVVHYGYTKEEFLGMNIRNIRPVEDIEKMEAATKQQNHSIRKIGVWTHLKKDGTPIKVEITSHDINYQNQHTRLILSNDITEKVKAEEALLKLNSELRALYTRQQNIREEERKYIAREIHDELGQLITGLKMDISWLKQRIIVKQPELTEKLNESIGLLDESVKTIRKISTELRPGILDDLGISDALNWLAKDFEKRTQIKCTINNLAGNIKCSDATKVVIFRVFQEALTNIIRHAEATEVTAEILQEKNTLTMQIADNGKGYDVNKQTNNLGILGMKERIANIDGNLYISSAIGRGTTITIIITI